MAMAAGLGVRVELGFLEKAESPEELTSACFPSKVGGKPAWLDPTRLPTPEETACSVCGVPRAFLLQVYAPPHDIPSAFHRSFFLFVCLNSSCHQRNSSRGFRVFRCQLPKRNSFYGEESSSDERESEGSGDESGPTCSSNGKQEDTEEAYGSPSETNSRYCHRSTDGCETESEVAAVDKSSSPHEHRNILEPTPLCVVCGSAGPKKCSRCKMAHYCSRHHQTHDWKHGHKLFCSDLTSGKCRLSDMTYDPSFGVCLPEFVMVTEEEPSVEVEEVRERGEEERMRDYHKFVESGKYRDHSNKEGKKLKSVIEKAESGTTSDKVFRAFKQRVALEPEQVYYTLKHGMQHVLKSQLTLYVGMTWTCLYRLKASKLSNIYSKAF